MYNAHSSNTTEGIAKGCLNRLIRELLFETRGRRDFLFEGDDLFQEFGTVFFLRYVLLVKLLYLAFEERYMLSHLDICLKEPSGISCRIEEVAVERPIIVAMAKVSVLLTLYGDGRFCK